jgi:hypothetical protein
MTRVWLVDRDVDSRNTVTMTYATPNGERAFTRQAALDRLATREGPTAAVDVEDDRLESVEDEETVERYAAEAQRVAEKHDPEDVL